MGLPGSIRKKNPNVVVGSGKGTGGQVWNSKLGRMTGTHTIPPPGPERESRLFKMVDGVRTIGSEVVAAEEKLADSVPASTNKGKAKTSTPAGVSSDVNTATTGTSAGSLLASIKSGLVNFMPAILVIGAVIVGIVIIKSAGKK
jgi:hypothetical protein